MTLQQLEYILAVTVPPLCQSSRILPRNTAHLSAMIQKLEEELDTRIF